MGKEEMTQKPMNSFPPGDGVTGSNNCSGLGALEQSVFALLKEGYCNSQIAEFQGLSEITISIIIAQIKSKIRTSESPHPLSVNGDY